MGRDHFRDYAVDAGYQFLGDGTHTVTVQGIFTHEDHTEPKTTGTHAPADAANAVSSAWISAAAGSLSTAAALPGTRLSSRWLSGSRLSAQPLCAAGVSTACTASAASSSAAAAVQSAGQQNPWLSGSPPSPTSSQNNSPFYSGMAPTSSSPVSDDLKPIDYNSMMSKKSNVLLGTLLVEAGLVTTPTLNAALKIQELVREEKMDQEAAFDALKRLHGMGASIDEYLSPTDFRSGTAPARPNRPALLLAEPRRWILRKPAPTMQPSIF